MIPNSQSNPVFGCQDVLRTALPLHGAVTLFFGTHFLALHFSLGLQCWFVRQFGCSGSHFLSLHCQWGTHLLILQFHWQSPLQLLAFPGHELQDCALLLLPQSTPRITFDF